MNPFSVEITFNKNTNRFEFLATSTFDPLTQPSFEKKHALVDMQKQIKGNEFSITGSAMHIEHINRLFQPTDHVVVVRGSQGVVDGFTFAPETREMGRFSGYGVYNRNMELIGIAMYEFKNDNNEMSLTVNDTTKANAKYDEFEIALSRLTQYEMAGTISQYLKTE